MKIQNINISANGGMDAAMKAKEGKKSSDKKTIFAGDMGLQPGGTDPLMKRKEEAQKQALKIVSDVFSSDAEVDQMIQDHRDNQENLEAENVDMIKQKAELEDQLKQDETQGGTVLDEQAKEDIQSTLDILDERINSNKGTMVGDSKAVSGIKIAQVKSHAMVDAEIQADKIMEAASAEIVGQVLKDAVDHIDETMEENKEDGEKLNEEIDKKQEMAESDTKKAEDAKNASSEAPSDLASSQQDVNKALKKVRDEMDLLEEDLKGVVVDEGL